jgi:hypothetical protein
MPRKKTHAKKQIRRPRNIRQKKGDGRTRVHKHLQPLIKAAFKFQGKMIGRRLQRVSRILTENNLEGTAKRLTSLIEATREYRKVCDAEKQS